MQFIKQTGSVAITLTLVLGSFAPLVTPLVAEAADTGYSFTTAVHAPTGTWSNPLNATSSNSIYATSVPNGNEQGYATFSIPAIPAGSTIDGIEVVARAKSNDTGCNIGARLSWDNGVTWTSVQDVNSLATSLGDEVMGGSSSQWGRTWDVNDFTNANFVVKLQAIDGGSHCDSSNTVFVDSVKVKVYYTPNTSNLVIDTINGAAPTGFCIAGPISITGHGVTGQQGGSWHLAIGWGDGATTTDSSGITTSGLSGSNSNYTFSASHTPLGPSTGITVILYHSQPSGQDGKVVLVSVCAAAPTQGVVVLKKTVINDSGGTKVASDFMLHINGNNIVGSSTGAMPGVLLNAASSGTNYVVSEDAVNGYSQTGFSCTVNGNATTTSSNTIKVFPGKNYVCTVTNNDDAPTVGTIHITKHVVNDNGGTATAGQWVMNVSASSTPNHFSGSEAGVDVIVTPGAYSVTESGGPTGYSASMSLGCSGSIAAGETKSCTITNDDVPPLLTLVKQVINGFRSTTPASAWTLSATGATTSISGVSPVVSGATFKAGSYTLAETNGPTTNYTSTIGCVTNGGATTTSSTIALAVGDTTTCTFINTEKQPGTLHVVKVVQNDNPQGFQGSATPGQFTLSISGGNASPSSVAGADAPGATVTIDAGATYNVSETGGPSGYGVSYSNSCNGIMPEGGDVTCTVTNNDTPPTQAYLTVVKNVVNNNGGTADASAWSLFASSTMMSNGVATLVAPGSYTIHETGGPASGYAQTGIVCAADGGMGVEGASVDIVAGHSYVCTITNDDIAPSLKLVKNVITDNGGTAVPSNWTLAAVSEQSSLSGAGTVTSDGTLQAGTFTLSEFGGPGGYTSQGWSCSGDVENVGNLVTLGIGQSAVCTITNDDQPGTLHIKKLVIRDNGGSTATSSFAFKINNGAPTNFESDGQNDVTVNAGTYDITEVLMEGWGVSYDNCSEVTVVNGGEATCTITNDDGKANLTIVKHTIGANGSFDFTVTGMGTTTITTANNTGSTSMALDGGSYNVVESVPTGWTLTNVSCAYDNDEIGNSIQNGEAIFINTGHDVTCTFTDKATGSDLSVTKSIDDNTPDNGQTVTYTLTASNAGPATTTGALVVDLLPSGLSYVSDTSGGAYATSTGVWTIGTLPAGSSTSMQIVATVTASAGQVVTNTATTSLADENVTDYNSSNDSSWVSFTTNTPNSPTPGGGGGGGGGGNGPIVGSLPNPINGLVLGTSTESSDCPMYLHAYIKFGAHNDPGEVTLLQQFLNNFEANNLAVNGTYDAASLAAVHAFQNKYLQDIMMPWGASKSTGYVYYTTRKEINTIVCKFTKQFPLTADQEAEIARIKAAGQAFIQGGTVGGSSTPGSTVAPTAPATKPQESQDENAIVGSANDNANQTAAAANATKGGNWWSSFLNWLFRK